ncbi:MAG: hypothetical protein ABIJ74_02780 [archaeon]
MVSAKAKLIAVITALGAIAGSLGGVKAISAIEALTETQAARVLKDKSLIELQNWIAKARTDTRLNAQEQKLRNKQKLENWKTFKNDFNASFGKQVKRNQWRKVGGGAAGGAALGLTFLGAGAALARRRARRRGRP